MKTYIPDHKYIYKPTPSSKISRNRKKFNEYFPINLEKKDSLNHWKAMTST